MLVNVFHHQRAAERLHAALGHMVVREGGSSVVTWPLLIINNPFQKYSLLYILQLNTKTR